MFCRRWIFFSGKRLKFPMGQIKTQNRGNKVSETKVKQNNTKTYRREEGALRWLSIFPPSPSGPLRTQARGHIGHRSSDRGQVQAAQKQSPYNDRTPVELRRQAGQGQQRLLPMTVTTFRCPHGHGRPSTRRDSFSLQRMSRKHSG